MIRQARAYNRSTKFWFTETGGIVKFGRNFPCSTERAKNRLRNMFDLAKRYRSIGVGRVYVYHFTGAGCSARFDAGLTNPDGTARPGYTYLRSKLRDYLRYLHSSHPILTSIHNILIYIPFQLPLLIS